MAMAGVRTLLQLTKSVESALAQNERGRFSVANLGASLSRLMLARKPLTFSG